MSKNIEVGWLAGIIDGEGCLTIRMITSETKSLGKRAKFQPQLSICNTNKRLIDKVEKVFEQIGIEKYRTYKRERKSKVQTKTQWEIMLYATGLRKLIPEIKGICTKTEEIELIEKFLETNTRKGSMNPYTNEELLKMEELRWKLVELHGLQAKKLCKPMPKECLMTPEQKKKLQTTNKNTLEALQKGRDNRWNKKKQNGDLNDRL